MALKWLAKLHEERNRKGDRERGERVTNECKREKMEKRHLWTNRNVRQYSRANGAKFDDAIMNRAKQMFCLFKKLLTYVYWYDATNNAIHTNYRFKERKKRRETNSEKLAFFFLKPLINVVILVSSVFRVPKDIIWWKTSHINCIRTRLNATKIY